MNDLTITQPAQQISQFYCFDQNNSGGNWVVNDRVCHFVIIEARSANEANRIAADLGIYFDGCEDGVDCDCCGDRWYRAWSNINKDTPLIYGTPPEQYNEWYITPGNVYCRVFYLDGMIKEYRK